MQENALHDLRHSTAHLLAQAVSELYPGTLLTIGPVTPEGFFYDFLPITNFKEDDLARIEARMRELAAQDLPITQHEMSKVEARKVFANNPYKLELIDGITDEHVGISRQGDFYDLCKGGHVSSTDQIKHFKLLGISGSYWRADRKNQALQRISGTAFLSAQDLTAFEKRCEEALKYDHRAIGKQQDLFSFHEEGVGFPFFHPKGRAILNVLIESGRQLQRMNNFQEISTPIMLSDELWRRSGHYTFYKDNMYFTMVDDRQYAVKPMNCPGAMLVYKDRPHSYRELPLRLSEYGLVHRHELSGVLHGLTRVRAFTQDDAHIFCMPEQIESEILRLAGMIIATFKKFGFQQVEFALSTRPKKSMGSDELWERATNALKHALDHAKLPYVINEGDGAFYGPKIDLYVKDSMERRWQMSTVQLDFFQPENFDLLYVTNKGTKERPVMIHFAIYGSLERFFAVLLEHHKGNLPFWLAPIQLKILSVTPAQQPRAQELMQQLRSQNVRTEIDLSDDPLPGQIKTAQLEKIPWMIIIGPKEAERGTYTLRKRDGSQEPHLTHEALMAKIKQEQTESC